MASSTHTFLLMLSAFCLSCKVSGQTSGPEVIQEPLPIETIEGGSAIFTCIVKRPHLDIDWLVFQKSIGNVIIYSAGLSTSVALPHFFLSQSHGNYSTTYETSGELHIYTLRIENVTANDGLFDFACAYSIADNSHNQIGQSVSLTVWPGLMCSYSPSIVPIVLPNSGFPLTLTCTHTSLNPLLQLSWSSNSNSLSTSSTYSHITLSPADNGREFICEASHPSLSIPLSCSVIPYNVYPLAKLSPKKLTITDVNKIQLFCENIGDATSDTYFMWYWDDSILQNGAGITITYEENNSTVSISITETALTKDTIITCEISIPNISVSNATATLELDKTSQEVPGLNTTDDDDKETNIVLTASLTIVIPIVILFILIIIGLCLFEKKCLSLRQRILYSDGKRPQLTYEHTVYANTIECTMTPQPAGDGHDRVNMNVEEQNNGRPVSNSAYVIEALGDGQNLATNNPTYTQHQYEELQ